MNTWHYYVAPIDHDGTLALWRSRGPIDRRERQVMDGYVWRSC